MTDRLTMDNYLLVLKSTVEVYVHGTLESSNEDTRSNLKENLNDILTSQANTYDLMAKFGWYPTNNVGKLAVRETLSKVKNSN